jgi:hypothetical protein
MDRRTSLVLTAGISLLACRSGGRGGDGAADCETEGDCAVDASSASDAAGADAAEGEGGGVPLAATCSPRIALRGGTINSDLTGEPPDVECGGGISLSPDGSKRACVTERSLWTVNEDGTDRKEFVLPDKTYLIWSQLWFPRWAPVGTQIAVAWSLYKGSGELYIADDATGEFATVETVGSDPMYAWSPDGKLAIRCLLGALCTVNMDGDLTGVRGL